MPVQTQDEVLTTEELAYIAGLFDGEGTVTINVYNAKRPTGTVIVRYLQVSLSSTDPSIIEYLKETFGYGSIFPVKEKSNSKPQWRWLTVSWAAVDVLSRLMPYLRIKKEHAIVGIDFQLTLRPGIAHSSLPPDLIEWQEFYITRIRELNRRGNGKLSKDS